MRLIAHRGLMDGPDDALENRPDQISKALSLGFDCEIDLWIIDSEFILGHDGPQYPVDRQFLTEAGLWIHAKNLDALQWLTGTQLTYFWHENDKFTITSNQFIWTYPGQELTPKSIMLMPEWNDPELENIDQNCYGICSDYVNRIKMKL